MQDVIDQHDFNKLLAAIIKQGVDDYIKLQHPKYRKKKYLLEAYYQAIDMFFDEEYRFMLLQNDDGEDMSLKDILTITLNTSQFDITKLKEYIHTETISYWDEKGIKTMDIPETICISGIVWKLHHKDQEGTHLNWDSKIITLNKQTGEEDLIKAILEIICKQENIEIKLYTIHRLAKAWFRTLKINNCFTGVN